MPVARTALLIGDERRKKVLIIATMERIIAIRVRIIAIKVLILAENRDDGPDTRFCSP